MASEAGKQTVFLSYAHADAKRARAIADALTARGHTVWWDTLIEGGASFAKSIGEALETADAVVVLWSKTSIDSDWVADEAAQGRDRKRLVPVSLDRSPPPLGFRQYQTIDVSGRNAKPTVAQVDRIDRAIAAAIGGKGLVRPTLTSAVDRRGVLMVAGGTGVVLAGGGAIYAWRNDLLGGGASARTIAVLPFKNLSGDSTQSYLSDGLTEEVRAALTRNAGLQVLAATTSNTARDSKGGATAIAGKLGVAHLLEGSVQRAGDVIRVAIDLTDGATGFSTWSKRIDARLTDIFAFQTEIARTVSEALSVRMATQDPAPGGTRNVAAYEAYLRGKALYENAITADPDFAMAHAALSRVLSSIASAYAPGPEIKATYAAAIDEGRTAIRLAPELAEAHLALGYAVFAGRIDVKGARQSYDLAYRFGRGNADILLLYALYTVRARRFAEAKAAIERAVALDPLNPRSHRAAGMIGYSTGDNQAAIGHLRRAIELNPQMANAKAILANCLIMLGQYEAAREALTLEKSSMFRLTGLAILEHRVGNRAAAERAYRELVRDVGDAALYQQAEVMAQWGRPDAAMALFAKARKIGDSGLTLIASDPMLAPLRRDPRFTAFVRDLGFA